MTFTPTQSCSAKSNAFRPDKRNPTRKTRKMRRMKRMKRMPMVIVTCVSPRREVSRQKGVETGAVT